MISIKRVKLYCCENISLIENYDKAINDNEQVWDCHHRLETDLNLSIKELKEKELYFHRPASELIFLTHYDHSKLHSLLITKLSEKHKENISEGMTKYWAQKTNRSKSEETKRKMSESRKRYLLSLKNN